MNFKDDKHAFFYLRKTVNGWGEKKYTKYTKYLIDLPTTLYIRVINNKYEIYQGILIKNNDKVLTIKDTYKDKEYRILYNELKNIKKENTEFKPEKNIGIYIDANQLKSRLIIPKYL